MKNLPSPIIIVTLLGLICNTTDFLFAQTSPELLYGTYLGSSGYQLDVHSALLPEDNLVIFSSTSDADDLGTEGAFMNQPQGGSDCWLTKISVEGVVLWSTYFGGTNNDSAKSVVCDAEGNIYIAGESESNDLPVTIGAFQEMPVGSYHPFLAKFDGNGALLWCTYFDSLTGAEGVYDLVWSDSDQRLFLLGHSFSGGLATPGAYFDLEGNGTVPLLAAFTGSGSIIYITYLPWQFGTNSIALDVNGNVYLGGSTNQLVDINFEGAYKSVNESYDGLIMRMDDTGWPVWGTYFGGEGLDHINTLTCDSEGDIYFGGSTNSLTEIATPGAYQSDVVEMYDGMLGKITSDGQLAWSTYFGTNNDWEAATKIIWGADDYLYLLMHEELPVDLTVSPNTFQAQAGGGPVDYLMVRITGEGQFQWVSFLGGENMELADDVAITTNGEMIITGATDSSTNFATEDAIQPNLEGNFNAFLLVFDPTYCIYGCTQSDATNYNSLATCDDGTCFVSEGSDLNGDGVTDINDLLLMMEEFGCIADCLADLDGDGIVGMLDLMMMIGEL